VKIFKTSMNELFFYLLIACLYCQSTAVLAEQKLHRDNWYLSQPEESATIQMSGHESESDAVAYIEKANLSGDIGYYQTQYKNMPWYAVTYGNFKTLDEARSHLELLPEELQQHSPWPRTFKAIKILISVTELATDSRDKAAGKQEKPEVRQLSSEEHTKLAKAQKAFTRSNYKKAHDIWMPLAENGIAEAQYSLGFLYQSGWGPEQNLLQAAAWYSSAAEQNEARAQFNLGVLLIEGEEVVKDTEAGVFWLTRSADGNNTRAKEFLINAYEKGKYGIEKSPVKAEYWKSR
jgi:hypothetical protein